MKLKKLLKLLNNNSRIFVEIYDSSKKYLDVHGPLSVSHADWILHRNCEVFGLYLITDRYRSIDYPVLGIKIKEVLK